LVNATGKFWQLALNLTALVGHVDLTVQVLGTPVLAATVTPVTVIVVAPAFAVTEPPCRSSAVRRGRDLQPRRQVVVKLTTCVPVISRRFGHREGQRRRAAIRDRRRAERLVQLGLALTTIQLCVTASRMFTSPLMFDGGFAILHW
jgi:hypothetical protein